MAVASAIVEIPGLRSSTLSGSNLLPIVVHPAIAKVRLMMNRQLLVHIRQC